MLNLTKDQLKAALICAAKKDIRTYLNGVYFDPAGYVVTMDGHRLLIQKTAAFEGDGFIVPRASVEGAVKMCGKYQTIEVTRSTIGAVQYMPIDERFPDWRKVTPESVSGEPASFDADYVADFKRIQEIITGRTSWFTASAIACNGAATAICQIDDGVFGVIMPLRLNCVAPESLMESLKSFLYPSAPELQAAT